MYNSDSPIVGNLKAESPINIVLGFDYGTQNLGIAVGNGLTNTAQPLKIVKVVNNQPNWEEIEKLLKEWEPQAFIVGIPYTKDGTITDHHKVILKFINRLHGRFGLPVYVVDESNSSIESSQYIKPSKRKDKGQLDAISAAIIVERWLNRGIFI